MKRSGAVDVVLVNMPFAEVQRPSIALGLLHASLKETEIRSEVIYANLWFAETVGLASYQALQATATDHLLGEWCFSANLFPENQEQDEEYLNLVLEARTQGLPRLLDQRKKLMRWIRGQTSAFLDRLAEDIVARGPRIVGCSSVFQQHCASLALLKRIHELSWETILMMGGANCESEMGVETLAAFPWLDCVVSGEADAIFPDLCRILLEQGRELDTAALPYGAISQTQVRAGWNGNQPPRPVVRDLDKLPTPNYDHYFDALRNSPLSTLVRPGLLAESSRGCWWGEKSHCTFCGLNGTGMAYRSKSAPRVLDELKELSDRYGIRSVQFVDNILDMSFFKTVLPHLAQAEPKYALFYETKANLKREQVKMLSEAGVGWIQPGIESLDDNVLRLIAKGNSTFMNLQLLKWAMEYGIHVSWNMLSGVPGACDSWYAEMAEWLPAIFHFQPPSGVIRIRYDRFSPYHSRPQDFGLSLEPSRAYQYVYPLSRASLMRLAYSFEDSNRPGHAHRGLQEGPGQQRLQDAVQEWNFLWNSSKPQLQAVDDGERLHFLDTRPCALEKQW
ncbi:MAG TPA: RiPP maturation radical SAM C-methyltransferase, partial [Candidatus Angelobacter sp.]|nr:RiPP maturation radical SAM C-methyltransferase [Candidatus Angelobacter sp.]